MVPAELFSGYGCSPEQVLFFDIETTGLSADTSFLYLICVGFLSKGVPVLRQWFSEGFCEESCVLDAFFELLQSFSVLVHYNGSTFDLPYLEKKCRHYERPYSFRDIRSIDLYRAVQPHKALLSLSGCRQKEIETALGICRKDQYDGGQLIELYKQYLGRARFDRMKHGTPIQVAKLSGLPKLPSSPSEALLYLLLLHNYEDVEGLIQISGLLSLFNLLNGTVPSFSLIRLDENELTAVLPIHTILSGTLLPPKYLSLPFGSLTCSDNKIILRIPVSHRELKYFYSNYKEYYFLPAEDCAVHKSVAAGVDKQYRKQATASTCYIRKCSSFLPQRQERYTPFFRAEYKSALSYFEADRLSDASDVILTDYVNSLFKKDNRNTLL